MLALIVGWGLWELMRPKRSKLLPRQFVLAVTPNQVFAFRSVTSGSEDRSDTFVKIDPDIHASWPRESVSLAVTDGPKSKGGTLTIEGESFPVTRPNLSGDPNTDELVGLLAGAAVAG
jgi:hypothetical protein